MELRVKHLNWSAGLPVAMLNKGTANRIGIYTLDRIIIKKSSKEMISIVDVGDIINEKEIAVTSEIKERLNLKTGDLVEIKLAPTPKSFNYIKKKLNGKELNEQEILDIVKDIISNALSEPETALFISAMYKSGMNLKETIFLIKGMLATGKRMRFKHKLVVDKHSIGGIAGNRTTPIIVPICASTGLIFPKTSSRAITSAAGTADVIEVIAQVEFTEKEIMKIIHKTNACIVWGGTLDLSPADEKMIQIEKMLKIDPESQLLASIMSKKLAVDSDIILIDIPFGKSAKVTKIHALKLKNKFERIAKYFKRKIKAVLTQGKEPIGNGIGPVLEMRDILAVLKNKSNKPLDLEEKSLFLAGNILEMAGKAKKGKGQELAKEILYSGKAFEKFEEIIKAQGGKVKEPNLAKFKKDIFSNKRGIIEEIDNKKINSLARVAGSPEDKAAGIYLYNHIGYRIKKGEKLLTIYSESKERLEEATKFYNSEKPMQIK